MKITKQTNKKQAIILVAIALLLGGGTAYAIWESNNTLSNQELTERNDKTSSVKEQQTENSDKGNSKLPSKPSSGDESSSNDDATGNDSGDDSDVTPEKPQITRASQNGDTIKVTAILQHQSSGSCELHLAKAGQKTITRNTEVIVGPSYYACGFELARSELPVSGQWKAVVVHKIGSAATPSDSETLQVD